MAADVGLGLGVLGAGLGAGLAVLGAALGISRIAGNSAEAVARQPEAAGDIKFIMILTAAMIEGVAFFGALICLLIQMGWLEKVG